MTLKQVLVKINDKNKIKCQSLRFNLKITMAVFNVTHCLMLYENECVCVCVCEKFKIHLGEIHSVNILPTFSHVSWNEVIWPN